MVITFLTTIGVALAGLPAAGFGLDEDPAAEAESAFVWVTATGDGEETTHVIQADVAGDRIFVAGGGEDEDEAVVHVKVIGDGGAIELNAPRIEAHVQAAADPNRGWLGVSLGEVAPALAAQLGLSGDYVLINNVVEGSPAEEAGLQQYDIIVSVNGELVEGSVGAFAQAIGDAGPGGVVDLEIIRAGQNRTLTATLTQRPQGSVQWQNDWAFGPSISERFRTQGKVMKVDPDGNVIFHDLGNLKDLKNLPDELKHFIPNFDDIQTQIWVDDGGGDVRTHVKTVVEVNGETLEIEQQDEQITVRRTTVDQDGNEETVENVYADGAELEAADPDAYEYYSQMQKRHVIELKLDKLGDFKLPHFSGGNFDFRYDVDLDNVEEDTRQQIADAMKSYEEAMKGMKHRPWKYRFFSPDQELPFGPQSAARHEFNVDSDGTITVRIKSGDSEVISKFDSENDLQQRNPDLFEKYRRVMDAPLERQ